MVVGRDVVRVRIRVSVHMARIRVSGHVVGLMFMWSNSAFMYSGFSQKELQRWFFECGGGREKSCGDGNEKLLW